MDLLRLAAPPITRQEWDALVVPEAYKAEIIQGEIVLSPGTSVGHGYACAQLFRILDAVVPAGFVIMWGPEWSFEERGRMAMAPIPDLIVIPPDSVAPLAAPPLLAVEVLSKSDGRKLVTSELTRIEGKHVDYGTYGLADYLEVDILGPEATVTRYEGREGRLVEVDRAVGSELLRADRPFRYEVLPAALVR